MSDEVRATLPEGQPALRVMPMAADINGFGAVFGGWTMAQMDIAGGVTAMKAAGGKVTTAAASIDFERPIKVGNIVSLYAEVLSRGRTSLKVKVEAYAEPGSATYADEASTAGDSSPYSYRAASAEFIFVAIDELGHKRALPSAS